MMKLAPVILFVYNRPEHTEKTLEALMNNELANESELFIFADGAKLNATQDQLLNISETRKIIRKKNWCSKVSIIESETNKGLSQSVIDGVTKILNEFEKVIVLEDDLVTSRYFLHFMNEALTMYESASNVACISGYIYPVKGNLPETFFIKGADCWGWATWKRAWDLFEMGGQKLLNELETNNLCAAFDFENTYPYTQMLKDQIEGKNDSWAIRWYASAFLKNNYCLYPCVSFVQNIGIDGSGTHSGISNQWDVKISNRSTNILPIAITENAFAKKAIVDYFASLKLSNSSNIDKLLGRIRSVFKK